MACSAAPASRPTPITTKWRTPTTRPRASTSSGPSGKYSGSRWQCESTSACSLTLRHQIGVAIAQERAGRIRGARLGVTEPAQPFQRVGRLAPGGTVETFGLVAQQAHDVLEQRRERLPQLAKSRDLHARHVAGEHF